MIVRMAAVVTGSKTVTVDVSPQLTAATLTALLAIAPELWTVAQFHQLRDALDHVEGGRAAGNVVGALLP